jgi:hypothetical protein
MNIKHCPLCGFGPIGEYATVIELRSSYDICSCCGCEYGYDDIEQHYEEWVKDGCEWFTPEDKPKSWSLDKQIENQIRPWPPKPGNN